MRNRKIRTTFTSLIVVAIVIISVGACQGTSSAQEVAPVKTTPTDTKWWGSSVDRALKSAGEQGEKWREALKATSDDYKVAMEFLVSNMPSSDFAKITPEFLLENIRLAYAAREQVAWGKDIPEEIFLNDVLPYCNIDEPRDPWRQEFYDRFIGLAKSCKSPAEVAQKLNESAFAELKVKYSTKRKRANQSPKESIEQGLASCTGLSIILVNACRAVCVPSRLAGIAKWPNKRGNHTWVEVWDQEWQFTGAAEPSKKGLNDGWFVRDAAQAIKDSKFSSIRAVSFARKDDKWPLVWNAGAEQVSAVNVTDRYTALRDVANAKPASDADTFECRIVVREHKERVESVVSIMDLHDATKSWVGHSRGESADTNDILLIDLPKNRDYLVTVRRGTDVACKNINQDDATGTLDVDVMIGSAASSAGTSASSDAVAQAENAIGEFASSYFSGKTETAAPDILLDLKQARVEAAMRAALWAAYCRSDVHDDLANDFQSKRVRYADHESPYTIKNVGERGPNGWPLFIAMHGGGGTRQEVNDSQWRHMQIYYRDQTQLPGYKYLALRAPNDTWNGFYDDYVYPLIHELIRQQVVFNDVDPNRIYIMGYSHGGYGAFAIGPKMPDHFAAIHSSAAAPTDGQSVADTLRNTRFTYMIGAKDTAYGRADRCQAFAKSVDSLRGDRKDIYPVEMFWKPDHGHGGLPDRQMISGMYPFQRNPVPRELTWRMSDTVIRDFYWLSCDSPNPKTKIQAKCVDNKVTVSIQPPTTFSIWLDSRLVDFAAPIEIVVNGKKLDKDPRPTVQDMVRSLDRRHDPFLSFSCQIEIPAE